MSTAHTPGRLYADLRGNLWRRPPSELYENGGGVAGDRPVATAHVGWHGAEAVGYPAGENARRIAAGWNAFDGITTDRVELIVANGSLGLGSAFAEIGSQRDELLAACEFVLANAFYSKWQGDGRAFTMLTAAVAKAKGGAA